MKKKVLIAACIFTGLLTFSGCDDSGDIYNSSNYSQQQVAQTTSGDAVLDDITYDVKFYNGKGENYLNLSCTNFDISPNKVKQWGYNSDGHYTSYYETSSVVTFCLDDKYIESCGSTTVLMDSRLELIEMQDLTGLDVGRESSNPEYGSSQKSKYTDYTVLRYWWNSYKEKGQGGEKIILIRSQDGTDIGMFVGKNVEWDVAGKLPKTTRIMIDNKPLFIHRCDFNIIDTAMLDNIQK